MKRTTVCLAALLCAALAACSKSPEQDELLIPEGYGVLQMRVASAQDGATSGYDPLSQLCVRIFNDRQELLRKYDSQQTLPERLELLAGSYRTTVEAGEAADASFEKRFYKGEAAFEVTPGAVTPVEVACKLQSTVAEVRFDATVAEQFGEGYSVRVVAADSYDERRPSLVYTADATGYYTLQPGVSSFCWRFEGEHPTRGTITREGKLTNVSAGDRCLLTFRFSKDLPGFIECLQIVVDPSADEKDDTIVWTDLEISGPGVDAPLNYIPGQSEATYRIAHSAEIKSVTVEIGDQTIEALGNPDFEIVDADGILSVTLPQALFVPADDQVRTATRSQTRFTPLAAGEHRLTIRVTDINNGTTDCVSTIRLQGLLPVEAADYNPWNGSLTLRALVFDPQQTPALFTLGEQRMQIEEAEEEICTATFATAWSDAQSNPYGLSYYTPLPDTGIAPGRRYDIALRIGQTEYCSEFTAPAGDAIANAGMDHWTTYNVVGGSFTAGIVPYPNASSSDVFWTSGNNKQSELCSGVAEEGCNGPACAGLQPKNPFSAFAAGNLFTGTFECASGFGTYGFARFGVQYGFTARPKALRLRYKAVITPVTTAKEGAPVAVGDIDTARIYVCVTDWKERHSVKSGLSYDVATFWDPEKTTSLAEGDILAYGSRKIFESSDGWTTEEIPLLWYRPEAAAPAPNRYSLVISCATAAYGDYMCGSLDNRLYVEDFEWVY